MRRKTFIASLLAIPAAITAAAHTRPASDHTRELNRIIQLATSNPTKTIDSTFTQNEAINLMRHCFTIAPTSDPNTHFNFMLRNNTTLMKWKELNAFTIDGGYLNANTYEDIVDKWRAECQKSKGEYKIFALTVPPLPEVKTIFASGNIAYNLRNPKTGNTIANQRDREPEYVWYKTKLQQPFTPMFAQSKG